MMHKISLIIGLFVIHVCNGVAQLPNLKAYRPYSPASLPADAPTWMAQLNDLSAVNYHAMVDSFNLYLLRTPEARRKTPRTKPIVNHFRRWQKHYLPYVQADGRIILPEHAAYRQYVAELNNTPAPITRTPTQGGWELLSPIVTYDWESKKTTPAQANVQRLGVSKSNPNILYCGTETGMVFRSTDKGGRWTACSGSHYMGGEISSIDVSPTNPMKVLVGAGTFLWLSNDGGDSWQDITPQEVRPYSIKVRDAVFHPTNDQQILVGNDLGLYQTADNGVQWKQISQGMCFDVKYKLGNASTIYALIQKKGDVQLEISRDGGHSFTQALPHTGKNLACGRIGLSTAPNGSEYVYVWACKADKTHSFQPPFYAGTPVLFKSTDSGHTWHVNDKIHQQMLPIDNQGGQGYYDMVVSASPHDPEKLLLGIIQLYASNDGGQTLMNKGGYYGQFDLHCDMQDLHVVGNDTWLSTDGGVIYSSDFFDQHADTRINGIYASELWGFDQGWNEDVMVGGRNHNGNMAQLDRYNGATISMRGSERATGYVFLSNPRKVTYSDAPSVVLPDDWKEPFVPFLPFWRYPAESMQFGIGLEFDPRYAKSFLIIQGDWEQEYRTLWKTVDDGNSFVALHEFPAAITSHVISRANPNKIVVATTGSLYASMDGGNTFKAYSNLPTEFQNAQHIKVAIHPTNADEIWVTTGEAGEMFRTTDNGISWERMDKNLVHPERNEKYIIRRFFLTGNEKNAVYAVGNVSRSLNNGYTTLRGRVLYWDNTTDGWQDYSEGLPPVMSINRMLPFYKAGKIRIATNNGIWQRDLVDPHFKPIAQPLILNIGKKDEGVTELLMDSYSIVNQNDAQWQWQFTPQPRYISDARARNPIVRLDTDQSYHVSLTVTTPQGTDTKTIQRMIAGSKDVITSVVGQEVLAHDVLLSANTLRVGSTLTLTPQGISQACQWQLFDASGKRIQHQMVLPQGTTQIATQGFTPGIYFYTLTNNTFKKVGKVIITKP